MKKIFFVALILLSFQQVVFAKSPKTNNDELVGSTFICPGFYGGIYTFFPNNRYNQVHKNIESRVTPISYEYDGKYLSFTYIGVNGKQRTLAYEVMYLKEKGKLIMTDQRGNQEICDEQ